MCLNISYETPEHGAHNHPVRPIIDKVLFPSYWPGLAIVSGEKFQIEYVDHIVVVEISSCRAGGVVAHANRQGIELINRVIVVYVTGQERDLWHRGGRATG